MEKQSKIVIVALPYVRFLLAIVFISSGVLKALNPHGFAMDIENYRLMLPSMIVLFVAYYLPWLEIVIGLGILFKKFYSGALILYLLLMLGFSLAIIAGLVRGLDISCGCFGETLSSGLLLALLRNLVLMAMILFLWKKDVRNSR